MTTYTSVTRYYIHGDLHEERPDAFRCARCDGFFPPIHFADNFHHLTLMGKLVQSVAGWLRKSSEPATTVRRPAEASNLFPAELAVASKVARHDEARWAKVTVDR